jgi:hypothetical protein
LNRVGKVGIPSMIANISATYKFVIMVKINAERKIKVLQTPSLAKLARR